MIVISEAQRSRFVQLIQRTRFGTGQGRALDQSKLAYHRTFSLASSFTNDLPSWAGRFRNSPMTSHYLRQLRDKELDAQDAAKSLRGCKARWLVTCGRWFSPELIRTHHEKV